jgi:hypothetical protein
MPCGDVYCIKCTRKIFLLASKEKSLFPPMCCKMPMSLDLADNNLTPEQLVEFKQAQMEFTTDNPVYCFNLRCGKFIPPDNIIYEQDVADCGSCGSITCIKCKQDLHIGECPKHESLEEVLDWVKDNDCNQCPNYLSMIQLSYGCNHMM